VCVTIITITIVVKEEGGGKKKEGGTIGLFFKPTSSGFNHQDVSLFGIVVISS
jgi:hypothetical protein